MLVDKIIKHYDSIGKERSKEKFSPIRGSNAGKCARALAYQYHGFDVKPLNARAIMVFELGDMIEEQLNTVASEYGLKNIQEKVSVAINGVEIFGAIDGDLNDPIEYPNPTIVDFKSAATHSAKNMERGNLDYGYICQLHFYMKAKGYKQALVVFYDKNISKLGEMLVKWDDKIWDEIVKRFTSVLESTTENLPEREFRPNDKGKLPWQCSYCQFVETCHPNYELTFDKNNKPTLKIKKG